MSYPAAVATRVAYATHPAGWPERWAGCGVGVLPTRRLGRGAYALATGDLAPMAANRRGGVTGSIVSGTARPRARSASSMAPTIAAGAAMVPVSPTPLN